MSLVQISSLVIGGVAGVLLRYFCLVSFVDQFFAIMVINVGGSFLAGMASLMCKNYYWCLFLLVGFLGSFTTFSTYILQLIDLSKISATKMIFYFVLTNGLSLISAYVGFFIARVVTDIF